MTRSAIESPAHDIAGYLTAYTQDMAFSDEEPADILDRYHTPDIEWFNDGVRLDRQRLIDHARPVRKNARSCELTVQDAIVAGDRIAARYVLDAKLRNGKVVVTEVYMFGQLAADGRLRRIDQITRTLRDR